jgi:uncharacterized protein
MTRALLLGVAVLSWCDIARAERNIDTQLRMAVKDGDLSRIELLLADGADAYQADALVTAIDSGQRDALNYLLQHHADPNAWARGRPILPPGAEGSPIYQAAKLGSRESLVLLTNYGVDPDAESTERGRVGDTALIIAAQQGDVAAARLLVEFGASANHTTANGDSALLEAILAPANASQFVKLLLAHGADPDIKNSKGQTARQLARAFGSPEMNRAIDSAKPPAPFERPDEIEHIREVLITKAGCDLSAKDFAKRIRPAYQRWRRPRARVIKSLESDALFQQQRIDALDSVNLALGISSPPADQQVGPRAGFVDFYQRCEKELGLEFNDRTHR